MLINNAAIAVNEEVLEMSEGATVPVIIHWQDPQKAADAPLDAVKKNKAEIFVPRFIPWLAGLSRGLGLPKLADVTFSILGANRNFSTMRKDRGRPF